MRPALKAGLLPVWRNRDTMQIGIDPRRAIALTGMGGASGLLSLLDGSRDREQVLEAARDLGIAAATAERVLSLLAASGVLDDFPAAACRAIPAAARGRLAPELATAALAHGDSDGGARTLARRRQACVHLHGTSRTGLQIASLLTEAGIGTVVCSGDAGRAWAGARAQRGWPPEPGPRMDEPRPSDERRPKGSGRRSGAWPPSGPRPDLVILADTYRRDLADAVMREEIPHLAAQGSEAIGVIGPLVLPGRSACLRCLDLTRTDRDPAWPLILAQLAGRAAEPTACDAPLAASVAAQATAQALLFIDRGSPPPAVTNGTLEVILPDWQWRRRSWRRHHRCVCGRRGES